jgi:hypothetical protein
VLSRIPESGIHTNVEKMDIKTFKNKAILGLINEALWHEYIWGS